MKVHYLTGEIWKSNSGETIPMTACWAWSHMRAILTNAKKEKITCKNCLKKMEKQNGL